MQGDMKAPLYACRCAGLSNTSVASDHNLTFYEAALLFGKDFEEAYLLKTWNESRREAVDSFKKENVKSNLFRIETVSMKILESRNEIKGKYFVNH